jgi:uncharacterized protein YukE
MTKVYKIKSIARNIANEKNKLESRERSYQKQVKDSSSWWEGYANDVFEQEYSALGHEIDGIHSNIRDLEQRLKNLASDVQRADNERERKEAERRRAGEQSNHNHMMYY